MPGVDRAMMTNPVMVALSRLAIVWYVASSSGRSRQPSSPGVDPGVCDDRPALVQGHGVTDDRGPLVEDLLGYENHPQP